MMIKDQLFMIAAWCGSSLASKSHLKAEYGCAAHAMRNMMSNYS